MVCFYRIWTSGHSIFRKFALMILTLYSMFAERGSTIKAYG
jgi:chitin synthase